MELSSQAKVSWEASHAIWSTYFKQAPWLVYSSGSVSVHRAITLEVPRTPCPIWPDRKQGEEDLPWGKSPDQGRLQLVLLTAQLRQQLLRPLLLFHHLLLQLRALPVQPPLQLLQFLAAFLLLLQPVCGPQDRSDTVHLLPLTLHLHPFRTHTAQPGSWPLTLHVCDRGFIFEPQLVEALDFLLLFRCLRGELGQALFQKPPLLGTEESGPLASLTSHQHPALPSPPSWVWAQPTSRVLTQQH